MSPILPDGSVVGVRQVSESALRVGDIVLVDLPHAGLVAHRLLRWPPRPGRPALSMGDRCAGPDPPLPPGAVLGRVERVRLPSGAVRDLRSPRFRVLGAVLVRTLPLRGRLRCLRSLLRHRFL